ncbi:hypothetical protein FQR65_LT15317 [Abscondita terminalis]|nr:hypothetical protein FQR65_LT15317 [Abscondita terminalis]
MNFNNSKKIFRSRGKAMVELVKKTYTCENEENINPVDANDDRLQYEPSNSTLPKYKEDHVKNWIELQNLNTETTEYLNEECAVRNLSDEPFDDELVDKTYIPSETSETSTDVVDETESDHSHSAIIKVQPLIKENMQTTNSKETERRELFQLLESKNCKKMKKKTICKFCNNNVTNFERHVETHHSDEKEVKDLKGYSKHSKEGKNARRKILALMRYDTEFQQFIENENITSGKLPCAHCKKILAVTYLRRHYKNCTIKSINETGGSRIQHRTQSQTLVACANNFTKTTASLRIIKEVYPKMKADDISFVAKRDQLIRHFGENYLKKHKRSQIASVCSNKLRECARLLIQMRKRTNNPELSFFEMLSTFNFDDVIFSTRIISGYSEEKKIFKAPSLAMHTGTLLKQICELAIHLLLKRNPEFKVQDYEAKIKDLKGYSKHSKEGKNARRKILALMRYDTEFQQFIENENITSGKLPCAHCKKILAVTYLRRHYKNCTIKSINETGGSRIQHRTQSQTLVACANNFTKTTASLRIIKEVYPKMKADDISFVAKRDQLIRHFGENYLKKHKRSQIASVCSNKLRECARLLIQMRKRTNNPELSFFEMLSTFNFDDVIFSTRIISGYSEEKKIFKAPSLAMHTGTLLKQICELAIHLLLKRNPEFKVQDYEAKIKDLKRFKVLVESQWNFEISSLAMKDLSEKKWNKPVVLPLTKDIVKFRSYILKIAEDNEQILKNDIFNVTAYKNLVDSSLTLTILFNRRRIGDVQYVTIESYLKEYSNSDQIEYLEQLTESEKVLTKTYKRIVAGGKGSRAIVILFPQNIQKYIALLLRVRKETKIVPQENTYLFAYPNVKSQWIRADVVLRKFAKASNLEHPQAMTSNRLRKHIATLMQLVNLSKDEYANFSSFMGHTMKTHQNYYE